MLRLSSHKASEMQFTLQGLIMPMSFLNRTWDHTTGTDLLCPGQPPEQVHGHDKSVPAVGGCPTSFVSRHYHVCGFIIPPSFRSYNSRRLINTVVFCMVSEGGSMSSELRLLGKYALQKRLGHGGMGEVWKAFDTQLQRHVAIKVLHEDWQMDPEFVTRFTREAQFIASLHHPNIVQIHDFQIAYPPEVEITMAYMVLDYVEGQVLGDFIRSTSRKGDFPAAE